MQIPDEQKQKIADAEHELIERAGALEHMTTSPGWEYAKAYIQNQIQSFANKGIVEGFKSFEDYKEARGEVNGLRKFIGEIEEAIQTLHEHRQKTSTSSTQ